MEIVRGCVVKVRLDPVEGSEQGKTRPCVVVQNDVASRFSSTTEYWSTSSMIFLLGMTT